MKNWVAFLVFLQVSTAPGLERADAVDKAPLRRTESAKKLVGKVVILNRVNTVQFIVSSGIDGFVDYAVMIQRGSPAAEEPPAYLALAQIEISDSHVYVTSPQDRRAMTFILAGATDRAPRFPAAWTVDQHDNVAGFAVRDVGVLARPFHRPRPAGGIGEPVPEEGEWCPPSSKTCGFDFFDDPDPYGTGGGQRTCSAGGEGSTSCSISCGAGGINLNCSTSCGAGMYSCCYCSFGGDQQGRSGPVCECRAINRPR